MNTIRYLILPALITVIMSCFAPVWADFGTVFGPWRYYAPYYFPPDVTQKGTYFAPDHFKPRYQDPNPTPQIPPRPASTPHHAVVAPPVPCLPAAPVAAPVCVPQVPCRPAHPVPTVVCAPPVMAPCPPMGIPVPHAGASMQVPMPVPYGPTIHPQPISPRYFHSGEPNRTPRRGRTTSTVAKPQREFREKARPEFPSSDTGTPRMVPGRPYPVYRPVPKSETEAAPDSSIQRTPRRSSPPNGGERVSHAQPPADSEFDPPRSSVRRAGFTEFDD